MAYTEIEQVLIKTAQLWRESPQYECTVWSDNTPFTEIGNGIKARATKEKGVWVFRAIFQIGLLDFVAGDDFYTLEESVDYVVARKQRQDAELQERIKLKYLT